MRKNEKVKARKVNRKVKSSYIGPEELRQLVYADYVDSYTRIDPSKPIRFTVLG